MVLIADDVHLVRAAQSGDTDAFEELIRRHQLAAYRVALRMLGSPADAEDATQEALFQVWRALPSFRGESAFTTWLYRIVVSRCLNAIAARRPAFELRDDERDQRPGPLETVEAHAHLENVKQAMVQLTPEQRAPLVLREFEGLSYEEIGEVLGISLAAVKGRLHRARLELLEEVRRWK